MDGSKRAAFRVMLVFLLLGTAIPTSGQVAWKVSYQHANSRPSHGGMTAVHVPLSTQSGVLSAHLRGEGSYAQGTTTYAGWNVHRINRAWSIGAGAGITITIWMLQGYTGLTGGVRHFTDLIEYVKRSTDASSPSPAPADRLIGYEEGIRPYLAGTAGLLIRLHPRVDPFLEYREWEVFRWMEPTPRNPFRSVHVGLSINLF